MISPQPLLVLNLGLYGDDGKCGGQGFGARRLPQGAEMG
jgi:hypothetical protein